MFFTGGNADDHQWKRICKCDRADIMEPKEETIHAALTAEDIRLLSAYHATTEVQKKIVG